MMDFSTEKSIPCNRFPRQWSCIETVLWHSLKAEFASAGTSPFHLAQSAVSTNLALPMSGVGNPQAKHIQALCTCMGQKKDNACQFLLLVCQITFILQQPYRMPQGRVLRVTSKDAHDNLNTGTCSYLIQYFWTWFNYHTNCIVVSRQGCAAGLQIKPASCGSVLLASSFTSYTRAYLQFWDGRRWETGFMYL